MPNNKKYSKDQEKLIPYFDRFMDRYSESNYGQKRNILIEFALYIETKFNKNIINAKMDEVIDYFDNKIESREINSRKIKRITKLKYRSVILGYYKLVKEFKEKVEGINFINPVPSLNIYNFSEPNLPVDDLEKESDILDDYSIVERILNYLFFTRKRLFIIVSLLLYTGARISEICSIKLKNIDYDERFFYAKVKSKKAVNRWGVYFFPEFFVPYLKEWVKTLLHEKQNAKYLFQQWDTHISTKTPRKHLRSLKNELGLTCKVNPHTFRDFINTERFDQDLNKKYRKLLLNQTPKDVNVKNYLKKYKLRKNLQKIYDSTLPFPEFKPKLNVI